MRVVFSIVFLFLMSCDSGDSRVNDFINASFKLEQGDNNGSTYYYLKLNESVDSHNEFGKIASEKQLMQQYLLWNLIDLEMSPEVRYSYHSLERTREKFYDQINSNSKVTNSLKSFLNLDQTDDNLISLDSLKSVASKLFFAKDLGEGRIQWTVCSGKSIFPQLYSEEKYFETVVIQAFCYQAIYNSTNTAGVSILDRFDDYISEIMPLLYNADSSSLEEVANQEMWKRMYSDSLLQQALLSEYNRSNNWSFKLKAEDQ